MIGGKMFDELRRMALFGSGIAELTRYRAEQMVKDLVKAGDIRREQASGAVKEMLDMARSNRKELLGLVRAEIQDQIANLGVASSRDADRLERRVARLEDEIRKLKSEARDAQRPGRQEQTGSTMAARGAAPKKTPAKKTPVKKTTAKKTTAKKTTAKKTTAKTSQTSKKTPAGRSPSSAKPADIGAGE